MTTELLLLNLAIYSLHILGLVAVAAALQKWLGLTHPKLRLTLWRVVLVGLLLLPLAAPYREPAPATPPLTAATLSTSPATPAPTSSEPLPAPAPGWDWLLALIATGAGLRLLWLAGGLVRLSIYRSQSSRLAAGDSADALSAPYYARGRVRASPALASPVTFGLFRPVILLPQRLAGLENEARRLAVIHEIIHARRRHWLQVIAEEIVRSLFWFHPAIHWLLKQITLAREQLVDRLAADHFGSRRRYARTLLSFAETSNRLPAPSVSSHLAARVRLLLKRDTMSLKKALSAAALFLSVIAVTAIVSVNWLPLTAAAAQVAEPEKTPVPLASERIPGVTYRRAPDFPDDARAGEVDVEVTVVAVVNEEGRVWSAEAVDGPEEFREPAVAAVRQWRFEPYWQDGVASPWTTAFEIRFRNLSSPGDSGENVLLLQLDQSGRLWNQGLVLEGRRLETELAQADGVRVIHDAGVETALEDVRSILRAAGAGPVTFVHAPSGPHPWPLRSASHGPQLPVRDPRLVRHTNPGYTDAALQAKVSGIAILEATVDENGRVRDARVLRSPGYGLGESARREIESEWLFEPAYVNGRAVPVEVTIEVTFSLARSVRN